MEQSEIEIRLKIKDLKEEVYDRMVLVEENTNELNKLAEPYNRKIRDWQQECVELNKQIAEEQNKITGIKK